MYRLLLISLVVTSLMACKQSDSVKSCNEIIPGETFEARVHETWCLNGDELHLTVNQIVADGRCNVQGIDCVWPGLAVLEFRVEKQGSPMYTDTLQTDQYWVGNLDLGGYSLSLLEILPTQRPSFDVDTASYAFRMVLE